jgi:hypothetical protein
LPDCRIEISPHLFSFRAFISAGLSAENPLRFLQAGSGRSVHSAMQSTFADMVTGSSLRKH